MATVLRHHVGLANRPRHLARRHRPLAELPLWLQVAALYSALALIVGGVIGLCFLTAWLATGSAI